VQLDDVEVRELDRARECRRPRRRRTTPTSFAAPAERATAGDQLRAIRIDVALAVAARS